VSLVSLGNRSYLPTAASINGLNADLISRTFWLAQSSVPSDDSRQCISRKSCCFLFSSSIFETDKLRSLSVAGARPIINLSVSVSIGVVALALIKSCALVQAFTHSASVSQAYRPISSATLACAVLSVAFDGSALS